jgi:hypothetical protein
MVLDQFLAFAKGRNAWVSVHRGRLQGLVGARQRGARQAWEIDYLIDATAGHEAVVSLLECATAETGRSGAEKLFLRLSADSNLLPAVREAGFIPYQEEVLYARGYARDLGNGGTTLRPVNPSDSYLLYRLYNQETPEATRRLEAATFSEWHASQERRWLRNGVQMLDERNGEILVSIKAARLPQGLVVEVMATPAGLDETDSLLAAAAEAVEAGGAPVFVVVPRTSEALGRRLEQGGFTNREEFICLMRRTTRPIALPKLTPAIVENAVGV